MALITIETENFHDKPSAAGEPEKPVILFKFKGPDSWRADPVAPSPRLKA